MGHLEEEGGKLGEPYIHLHSSPQWHERKREAVNGATLCLALKSTVFLQFDSTVKTAL